MNRHSMPNKSNIEQTKNRRAPKRKANDKNTDNGDSIDAPTKTITIRSNKNQR